MRILRRQYVIYARLQWHSFAVVLEVAGKGAGQRYCSVESACGAMVANFDHALGMGVRSCKRRQIRQMWRNVNSGKSRARWLDSRYYREQIIKWVRAPGVRIGTGIAGLFGPRAEVLRQQFSPRA